MKLNEFACLIIGILIGVILSLVISLTTTDTTKPCPILHKVNNKNISNFDITNRELETID